MGGHNGATSFSSAERLQVERDAWETLPPMERNRINAAAAASQKRGAVFVFQGSSLASVEVFRLNRDAKEGDDVGSWTELETFGQNAVRCRHVAVPIAKNDTIYIFGGYDGTKYLSTIERFVIPSRTFLLDFAPMSVPRCDLGGASVG